MVQIDSRRIKHGFVVTLAMVGLCSGAALVRPVQAAEALLDESGTIVPAEQRYSFDGQAGQTVTISLESSDFDSVVSLLGPAGDEIAVNDDFGGTLNSGLIVALPEDGSYTVVARSFSGEGGDFKLVVRPSTPFETTYSEAQAQVQESDFEGAIATYTKAIELDATQPSAYLGRAEAYLGQAYTELGENLTGPQDIPDETREAIISDFEKAASLFEAAGNQQGADSLREQIDFLQNGPAEDPAAGPT